MFNLSNFITVLVATFGATIALGAWWSQPKPYKLRYQESSNLNQVGAALRICGPHFELDRISALLNFNDSTGSSPQWVSYSVASLGCSLVHSKTDTIRTNFTYQVAGDCKASNQELNIVLTCDATDARLTQVLSVHTGKTKKFVVSIKKFLEVRCAGCSPDLHLIPTTGDSGP